MDRKKLLQEFFAEARKRELLGLATYGPFEPTKDTRILSIEMQEEAVDVLNYSRFLLRKHPHLREKTEGIKRLTFALYYELRKLEKVELELTRNQGGGN